MLELTVKTLDSQNHSFTVPDETTVRQLKENILEKMEVPIEIQRLIFHGKVLQDDKKLTDYGDVNGKVIHLVQRPPPPARGTNSSASDVNLRSNIRRYLFGHRDRLEGTTYLGAMAFPADLMEAQGMMHPPPSQGLSRTRLFIAKRMLSRAASSIRALENDGQGQSGEPENQENVENTSAPMPNAMPTAEEGSGREVPELLGAATGSITQAAQAATAAAIAAAVSAAQAFNHGLPHITIRGASRQVPPNPPGEAPTSNLEDVNLFLNIDDNHPEDVAEEIEIGPNNDTNIQDRPEGDSNGNNADMSVSTPNMANPPRRTVERTAAFASLLGQLEDCQRRFQPLLQRCRQLMVEDPSFDENSSPNAEECQRFFNGVSETMHHFAHAYHALSDIMVDFNEDTPRALRCRPVIIQHTAILETGFPVQQEVPEPENVTSQASASSFASAVTQQSEERSQSSQSAGGATGGGGPNNTSGFFLSGPGNVEIFMDFGPQGVTLGSVETSIARGSEARNPRSNLGSGIQLGSLGTGRPSIELIQSVQVVAGQIQNHLMGRMNQASQADQPPPPYDANVQPNVTLGESIPSNHSVSTQARSTSSTESTNATITMPTPRHQIHMGHINPGLTLSSYDPFLPCNSHHVRSPQRVQNAQGPPRTAAANTNAPNPNPMTSAGPNLNGGGLESERSNNNAHPEGTTPPSNPMADSYMAIMSHFLNPQRLNLNRGQPRPGGGGAGAGPETNIFESPEWVIRRFYPQSSQGGEGGTNEPPRNFTLTPLPNSILGWRIPTQGQPAQPQPQPQGQSQAQAAGPNLNQNPNAAGARRNIWEAFRMGARDAGADRAHVGPNGTIFDFLSSISDTSYVEGESIIIDFFVTLARNLTWQDIIELSMARRTMVESLITRLRPMLQNFVVQRLLQSDSPSPESIARGCERLNSEMRPYIELMQEARLRESVDLTATINSYNQSQLPEIISLIVDPVRSTASTFGQNITRRVRNYMRQLIAIIIHCCQDGNQGFDTIVQNCVRLLMRGIPEELQQWTEVNSVNNLRSYTANLNVPLEDIQRYLVYRIPGSVVEREAAPEGVPEPMETDSPSTEGVWVPPETIPSPEKLDEGVNDGLVAVDNENLPDVLIGSETWHNTLPSDWVPIIARDTQRQRRQSSQKPFSDAYLSSLPAKRRKLIASSKPQGNLSQVISDGVRQAINAAGISSPVAEKVIAEAGKDDVLQAAYKEQERVCVSADLKRNPDFSPSRFPNAFKYFDK